MDDKLNNHLMHATIFEDPVLAEESNTLDEEH